MFRYKILSGLFCLTFISISCQQDLIITNIEPIEEVPLAYDGVDEALWDYFNRFEEEAQERGIILNLRAANITGEIMELGEEGVAGQCTYNPHLPNHVTIDLGFWENASDRAREFVVFHELGHCELGRDHREEANANGTCLSLMRSGLGTCRDNYHSLTRPAYLDELFDARFFDEI